MLLPGLEQTHCSGRLSTKGHSCEIEVLAVISKAKRSGACPHWASTGACTTTDVQLMRIWSGLDVRASRRYIGPGAKDMASDRAFSTGEVVPPVNITKTTGKRRPGKNQLLVIPVH